MKTQGEKILKEFIKKYNEFLRKHDKSIEDPDVFYSYKVYVQKIPIDLKKGMNDIHQEEINCTVLEIIKNEKIGDNVKQTIIYEDYKPNIQSMFIPMKERLISTFIVKGLSTLIGALEHINDEYEQHRQQTDK